MLPESNAQRGQLSSNRGTAQRNAASLVISVTKQHRISRVWRARAALTTVGFPSSTSQPRWPRRSAAFLAWPGQGTGPAPWSRPKRPVPTRAAPAGRKRGAGSKPELLSWFDAGSCSQSQAGSETTLGGFKVAFQRVWRNEFLFPCPARAAGARLLCACLKQTSLPQKDTGAGMYKKILLCLVKQK